MAVTMALSIYDYLALLPAVLTLPLHIYIIVMILLNLRDRNLKSMYFMFVISQGITDVLAILCQVAFQIAPDIEAVARFFWSLRASSLPAWTYIHMHFFLIARSIGVVLICGQRFLSIAYTYSYGNMLLNSIPGICVIFFHFTLAVLIPLPVIYYQRGFEFADISLAYKMSPEMISLMNKNWIFGCFFVVGSAIASLIFILLAYYSAVKKAHTKGIRFRIEISILRAVSILLIAFFGVALYNITIFFFTSFGQLSLDDDLQYSLVSIIFSCVHPWTIVLCIPFFRYRVFFWLKQPQTATLRSENGSAPNMVHISI